MSSEDFKSFIVTNPDLVDEGIDVSGLRTTTDTSPFLLGNIPDSPGIQYSTLAPTKYTDLMRLYSSGLPTTATGTAQIPGAVDTLVDVGSGDGGQATTIQPIDTPINTGGGITNVDTPLTQMITDPVTGQTQTVRQAMTSDDAYRGVDEVEPYRDPIMDMVEQPQADSILAGEAMSRANTGLEDDFLNLIGQEDTEIEDIPVELPTTNIETAIEPQAVNTILGPDGITYDAVTGLPVSDDPIMDSDLMAIRQQQNALPQEQQDPGFWETARDNFIQTGQDVGNLFKDLGGQGIDIGKLAGTTILNLAGKVALGIPLLGTALSLLGGAESASGAQQGLVSDQFEEEGVTLDDIGRIQQVGLDYDTPENVMAGYSPGETGLRIGDITVGGGTIQESIVDRLADLEKTKNEKYNGSFYNADGTPKLNPDTGQPTKLGQREEALKENLNIVARAAGAVTLDGPQYTQQPTLERAQELFPNDKERQDLFIELNKGYEPFSDTKTAGITLGPGEFLPEGENLVTLENQLAEQAAAEQAQAAKIEAERRELQEINAAAAREQAAAEQRAREEADARIAAEAASRAAAARAAADAARRNQGSGNGSGNGGGGGRDTGGARGGGTSATSSGLGDLGFSDIRLKDNVELIGKSPSNINIYKFNYKGDSTIYQGAMANEVSWASVKANNGYLMIDYDKIDVEFKPYAKR